MTRRDETRRDETRRRILALGFVALMSASCDSVRDRQAIVAVRSERSTGSAPAAPLVNLWYDPTATTHDFGLILSGTEVSRTHTYRIRNTSNQLIKIRGIENHKPCCGDVASVAPADLEPGQELAVPVTIKFGLGSGQVVHRAVIEVEGNDPVDLSTTASAQARATLTEAQPPVGATEIGQSGRVDYLIRTFGVADDPPRTLDDSAIRCELATEWVGPATTEPARPDHVIEVHRLLRVPLPAARDFGQRRVELEVLGLDGAVIGRSQIRWEVAPTLVASPSGLIFGTDSAAASERKIIVRARDDQPFRIIGATTNLPCLIVEADVGSVGSHTVQARRTRVGPPQSQTGEVVITTNHPAQILLKIAVYIPASPTSSGQAEPSRSEP